MLCLCAPVVCVWFRARKTLSSHLLCCVHHHSLLILTSHIQQLIWINAECGVNGQMLIILWVNGSVIWLENDIKQWQHRWNVLIRMVEEIIRTVINKLKNKIKRLNYSWHVFEAKYQKAVEMHHTSKFCQNWSGLLDMLI